MTNSIYISLSGESAVLELDRSPVLLSATSHLLLGRKSLPHDAAGETPAVFHLEVQHTGFDTQSHTHTLTNAELCASGLWDKNVNRLEIKD